MWWLYALLSALAAAATALLVKLSVAEAPPLLATAVRTAFVLPCLLAAVWWRRETGWQLTGRTWLLLALSGATTALSWSFYALAMQRGKASAVSAVDKFSLVLTFLLAFVFLREIPTPRELLALCLITAGTLLLIRG